MQITINGEERQYPGGTILDLLQSLSLDARRVAVELNLDIIPKGEYGERAINEGDRIEIVHFVGGG